MASNNNTIPFGMKDNVTHYISYCGVDFVIKPSAMNDPSSDDALPYHSFESSPTLARPCPLENRLPLSEDEVHSLTVMSIRLFDYREEMCYPNGADPHWTLELPSVELISDSQRVLETVVEREVVQMQTEAGWYPGADLILDAYGLLNRILLLIFQYDRESYKILVRVFDKTRYCSLVTDRYWDWHERGYQTISLDFFDFFTRQPVFLQYAPPEVQEAYEVERRSGVLRARRAQASEAPTPPQTQSDDTSTSTPAIHEPISLANYRNDPEFGPAINASERANRSPNFHSTQSSDDTGVTPRGNKGVAISSSPQRKMPSWGASFSAPHKKRKLTFDDTVARRDPPKTTDFALFIDVDEYQGAQSAETPSAREYTEDSSDSSASFGEDEEASNSDHSYEEQPANPKKRKRANVRKAARPKGFGAPFPVGRPSRPYSSATVKYRFGGGRGPPLFAWSQGQINIWQLGHPGEQLPEIFERWNVSPLNSVCPPVSTDLRLLGDVDVSDVEILTYFPQTTLWREVCQRLRCHGWTANEIVKLQLWTRNILDPKGHDRTVVQHHFGETKAWAAKVSLRTTTYTQLSLGSISNEHGHHRNNMGTEDYRIIDLADGVVVKPTGVDKGLLTVVVQRVVDTEDNTVLLSGFCEYVNKHHDELSNGLVTMEGGAEDHGNKRWSKKYDEHADLIGFK